MAKDFQLQLQELGLLPAEAQVYLALVHNGPLGGSTLASVTGHPRSSVYLTLHSLLDKGLVEGGTGNGSRFSVVPPDKALSSLVLQEKEALAEREKVAARLGQQLSTLVEPTETGPDELIQVIRNPRAVAERYDRLRLAAEHSVEVFAKAPIFAHPGPDPVLERILGRGVRCRGVCERAVLNDPAVGPYLARWTAAGEKVRIYDGKLPHKLALFDRQSVFVALTMPGDQMRTVFIRHPELANSLGILFDTFWAQSRPFIPPKQRKSSVRATGTRARHARGQPPAQKGLRPGGKSASGPEGPTPRREVRGRRSEVRFNDLTF
jgi:sugar-specific transcriptional regulator TrmB